MCVEIGSQSEVFSLVTLCFILSFTELGAHWPISKLQGAASLHNHCKAPPKQLLVHFHVLLLPSSNVLNLFVVKMKPAYTETFHHVTTITMATKDDFIELSLMLVNATGHAGGILGTFL